MARSIQLLVKVLLLVVLCAFAIGDTTEEDRFALREVDPRVEHISIHWKNESGLIHGNIGALKNWCDGTGRSLQFAMNGGMFTKDHGPLGLYVENGRLLKPLIQTTEGHGNFYLQPNGVFGIDREGHAFVRRTADVGPLADVDFATQSGPMLLVDGEVNRILTPGSKNLHFRNAVGVHPDGRVLFVISRETVNFHDLAMVFKDRGYTNALYLDGFVSKAFIPEAGIRQMDGELGVLIAVIDRDQ